MPDQLFVGTSGFSYKEWKGSFYPKDLAASKYLGFYSRELSTTEINNTFYRMPSKKISSSWAEQVPEGFLFSVKMNQRVTHKKRLRDVKEEMGWFGEGVAPIREKLGCLLVQLPPWFKIDLDALASFLEEHLKGYRMAFEFRHSSWFCQETYDLLASRGAALCVAESEKLEAVREVTAPYAYLRLRKTPYSEAELQDWADWIKKLKGPTFVYMKHEAEGPRMAKDLIVALKV